MHTHHHPTSDRTSPKASPVEAPRQSPCHIQHGEHAPLAATGDPHHDDHDHHHDLHAHDAHHAHGHDHEAHQHDYRHKDKSLLTISFVITVCTMAAEIVTGLLTHSLALVSDGVHMFTHAFALGLSWAAIVLATRPANLEKTFGYYRIEVVAAFVNGLTILASAIWIVVEGITRLLNPEPINIQLTLIVAIVGLIINLITGAILLRGDQGNLNMRSAFLHMLTDTLSSVAIIIGLVVVHYTGWGFIDPLLALLIALLITKWAWTLLRESLHILLEGSPIAVDAIKAHIRSHFPEVTDMHDVHVWQISQRFNCLTAHLTIDKNTMEHYPELVRRINDSLRQKFEIGHTNFQPEWH